MSGEDLHRGELVWLRNAARRSRAVVVGSACFPGFVQVICVKSARPGRTGGFITGRLNKRRKAEFVPVAAVERMRR